MDDTIDEALTALQGKAPVYSGSGFDNLDNHGPMMAEALVTLGHPEAVMPWIAAYLKELPPAPAPRGRIDDWREALGDGGRYGDWQQLFRNELAECEWRAVVATWVGKLLPGMASAGAHGIIRVAHAVRQLTAHATDTPLGELAHALATWAAHYYELPPPAASCRSWAAEEAVAHLPLAPPGAGTTGTRLRALDRGAPFLAVEATAAEEPDAFLADLAVAFARAYLASAELTPSSSTGLVHSVTVPAAARLLLPYLQPEDHAEACRRAWQTAAGIYAGYGSQTKVAIAGEVSTELDELVERVVTLRHVHAVKFVEACCRAYSAARNDVFPLAAARAVEIHRASQR